MRIAITRRDGGVSIMTLAMTPPPELRNPDEQAEWMRQWIPGEITKWQGLHVGEYASHAEIPDEVIPTDRTFRAAWDLGVNSVTGHHKIDVDMTKARDVQMARIIVEENKALAALALAESHGANVDVARAALIKSVTDMDLTTATTPEALKDLWPKNLKPS